MEEGPNNQSDLIWNPPHPSNMLDFIRCKPWWEKFVWWQPNNEEEHLKMSKGEGGE